MIRYNSNLYIQLSLGSSGASRQARPPVKDAEESGEPISATYPSPSLDQPVVIMKNSSSVTLNTASVPRSSTHPLNSYATKKFVS